MVELGGCAESAVGASVGMLRKFMSEVSAESTFKFHDHLLRNLNGKAR